MAILLVVLELRFSFLIVGDLGANVEGVGFAQHSGARCSGCAFGFQRGLLVLVGCFGFFENVDYVFALLVERSSTVREL